MTTTTSRQHFRNVLAQVAERAKSSLPQAVNGRIESAVKLVLSGDVDLKDDGSALVGSSSDPMKTYLLQGSSCPCQDFQYGKAAEGWCQHRIAAAMAKRAQERLAAETPAADTVAHHSALPEAPTSVNLRARVAGFDMQITIRDSDETRLFERLRAVLARPDVTPVSLPSMR